LQDSQAKNNTPSVPATDQDNLEPKPKRLTPAQRRKAAFDALPVAEQEAQMRAKRIAKYRAKIDELEEEEWSGVYDRPRGGGRRDVVLEWELERDEARAERSKKRYERLLRKELGEPPLRKAAGTGKKGKWGNKKRKWQKKGKGGRK
jgi:hypothetical protein